MTEDDAKMLARALVDEVLRRFAPAPAPAPPPKLASLSEPVFMKVTSYAKSRGYSRSTIQGYLEAGMPCVSGRGGRRIDVRAADEWLRMGAAVRSVQ